jgi:hypothetical protein
MAGTIPAVLSALATRLAEATALASAAERPATRSETVLTVEVLMTEPASHAAKLVTRSASVLTVEVEVSVIEPATHAVKLATPRRTVPLSALVEAKRASTAAWKGKL